MNKDTDGKKLLLIGLIGAIITVKGSEPVFSSWVDVATYVDKNLL